MRYFEEEEIIVINQKALLAGEKHHVRDPNALSSAVARHKRYDDVFDVASALLESLTTRGHPFHQGNKRTAGFAMLEVLASQGYSFSMSTEKLAVKITMMTNNQWKFDKIRSWLKRHASRP